MFIVPALKVGKINDNEFEETVEEKKWEKPCGEQCAKGMWNTNLSECIIKKKHQHGFQMIFFFTWSNIVDMPLKNQ